MPVSEERRPERSVLSKINPGIRVEVRALACGAAGYLLYRGRTMGGWRRCAAA